jgi:hypothetical protein
MRPAASRDIETSVERRDNRRELRSNIFTSFKSVSITGLEVYGRERLSVPKPAFWTRGLDNGVSLNNAPNYTHLEVVYISGYLR